jgi:hypothetical protein
MFAENLKGWKSKRPDGRLIRDRLRSLKRQARKDDIMFGVYVESRWSTGDLFQVMVSTLKDCIKECNRQSDPAVVIWMPKGEETEESWDHIKHANKSWRRRYEQ